MKNTIFKIEFGKPENGWLPVLINYNEYEEKFVVSNIPFDPLGQLVDVIDSAMTNGGGEVWWHLEPGGFYLNIQGRINTYHVSLDFSNDSKNTTKTNIFKFSGSFDEVILPIWRSLKNFYSFNYDSWQHLDDASLESVKNQINSEKKRLKEYQWLKK